MLELKHRERSRFLTAIWLALLVLLGLPSPLLSRSAGLSASPPRSKEPTRGVMILSAPIFPADANTELLGQRFPGQFVFFDAKTMDVILAYPQSPGGPLTIHRIRTPPHVTAEIDSTVSPGPQSGYRYRYVVTNAAGNGQPIRSWLLPIPEPPPREIAEGSGQAHTRQGEQGPWRQDFHSGRHGDWSVRFTNRSGSPPPPGRSAVFVVDNENRPGIVTSVFHGAVSSVTPTPKDLPPEAREQLERITPNWGRVERWTIGPKFGKWASTHHVVMDYGRQLETLIREGILDRNSPFVQAVLARVQGFMNQRYFWPDRPFRPIGQPPDPASQVELQLDLALKLALVLPPLSARPVPKSQSGIPDPKFRETAVIPYFHEVRSSIVHFQTVYKEDLDGTHSLLLVRAGRPPGAGCCSYPHGDGILGLFVLKSDDPDQVWKLGFLDGYEEYHVEVEQADEKSMVLRMEGAKGAVYRNRLLFDLASKRMLKQYPLPAEAVIPLFDQEDEGFVNFQIAYSKDLDGVHTLLVVGAGRPTDTWCFRPPSGGLWGDGLKWPTVGLFLTEPGTPGVASKLALPAPATWGFKIERADGESIILHFQPEKGSEYKTKFLFDVASKRVLKEWRTPLPVREILEWNDEVYAAVAHPEQTAIVRMDEEKPVVVTGAERDSVLARVKRKSEPEHRADPLSSGEHRPVSVDDLLGFAGAPVITRSVDGSLQGLPGGPVPAGSVDDYDSLLGLPGSPEPPVAEFKQRLPLDSEGRFAVAGVVDIQTGRMERVDGIVERIGNEEKLYELPRSTLEQLAKVRPEEARNSLYEILGDQIGTYQVVEDRFWFGKSFEDILIPGIGGFGYFDPDERKFVVYSPPEIVSWSVSALAVNDREVWLGLVHHGEWGDSSGGLLRYERKSGKAQRFDLGESNGFDVIGETQVIRRRGISYVATDIGLFLFQDNRMTRLFFEPMLDGGLHILKDPK